MRAQSPVGQRDGVRQRHRAVAALHAPAPGPGGAEAGGERPVGARAGRVPSDGAESSAKPPPPRTTSGPELWKAGPSTWARHAASTGFRGSPAGRAAAPSTPSALHAASTIDCQPVQRHRWARRAASTSRRVGGLPAAAPSSAASRRTMPGVQKPHWLAPCCDEGRGPAVAQRRRRSLERGDVAAGDAAHGGDAGDAGRPVDPHGAAPALALGAAAVLDRAAAELLAQRVQEGDPVLDRDGVRR